MQLYSIIKKENTYVYFSKIFSKVEREYCPEYFLATILKLKDFSKKKNVKIFFPTTLLYERNYKLKVPYIYFLKELSDVTIYNI